MKLDPLVARLLSAPVRGYLRTAPIERGKYRLMTWAGRRFLVAPTVFGSWMRVSGVAEFEWSMALNSSEKEPATERALKRHVAEGAVVLDVGANVGYFTLLAAYLAGPGGRVHAFEPTPRTAGRLSENVALNQLRTVEVIEAAASDQPGSAWLTVEEDSEGNWLEPSGDAQRGVRVPTITLDGWADERGLARVDVVKMDCEGWEPNVLRGARRLLERSGLPPLIVEINATALQRAGHSAGSIIDQLTSLGYALWQLDRVLWRGAPSVNVLALPPSIDAGGAPSFRGL